MYKTLSSRVKELCSERRITLRQLSEKMGIKPESLSRALGGNPQLSTLENIANALEVGVAELLTGGRSYEPAPSNFLAVVIDHGQSFVFNHKSDLIYWVNNFVSAKLPTSLNTKE